MKNKIAQNWFRKVVSVAGLFSAISMPAQIPMSAGSYTQNFDSLGSAAANWINNTTLPGWYSSKGTGDSTNYLADTGTSTTGGLHSYGVSGVSNSTDRALGSIGASSITFTYGIRFTNNTASTQTNISISSRGEQWRNGTVAANQSLTFSYAVSSAPITNAHSAASWINFSPLSFVSPNLLANSSAIDGNASSNSQLFTSVILTSVAVLPGQELFLRWSDVDDSGFDSGLAIDDLVVSFNAGSNAPPSAPSITTQPQNQSATIGDNVAFTVVVSGSATLSYQWKFFGTNRPNATNATLALNSVSTNHAGNYFVTATNSLGSTNSQTATLTVVPPVPAVAGFSLMNYNTHGNFISDWTTNSLQIQAIGRQVGRR